MSNSKLISVKVPAHKGNYQKGRGGNKITRITIHHMAGILTAEQCGRIFQQAGRKASSNYGIGNDGKIGLYVDEKNRAYTSSSKYNDERAVTIEVSNCERGGQWKVSDKALDSTIELCVDVCQRNDIKKLVVKENLTYHRMFSATACPGTYLFSKLQYIATMVNARIGNVIGELPIENKSTLELAREVIQGKYGNGNARKQALGSRYAEVQAKVDELLRPKKVSNLKSTNTIAKEVIQGLWGNGNKRKENLTKAGYNYDTIQKAVNKLLGK